MESSNLRTAVEERKWEEVLRLLQENSQLCDEERNSAIDTFIMKGKGSRSFKFSEIVPHCNKEQLEKVLTRATKSGWWFTVSCVLQKGVCGAQYVAQALEEASKRANERTLLDILPRCSEHHLDVVLSNLVSRDLWLSTAILMKTVVKDVQCQTRHVEKFLRELMTRDLWNSVGAVLKKKAIGSALLETVIMEASERASDQTFASHILPFCGSGQLNDILTTIVTRGMWQSVGMALSKSFNCSKRKWVLDEAIEKAGKADLESYVLPRCDVNDFLEVLNKAEGTDCLSRILSSCDERQLRHILTYLWNQSKSRKDEPFEINISHSFHQCQMEVVVKYLVSRDMWQLVGEVLQRNTGEVSHGFVVQESREHKEHQRVGEEVKEGRRGKAVVERGREKLCDMNLELFTCSDDEREKDQEDYKDEEEEDKKEENIEDKKKGKKVTNENHGRGKTLSYKRVNDWGKDQKDYNDEKKEDKKEENIEDKKEEKTTEEDHEKGKILPYKCVSDSLLTWIVEEASKRACDRDFRLYILPYCSKDQRDTALTHLVPRRMWKTVGKLLKGGICAAKLGLIVEEASKSASMKRLKRFILSYCTGDIPESVITNLVSRGMWRLVNSVLKKGVGDSTLRWVVAEGSRKAGDKDFAQYVLPYCPQDQLDIVLICIVKRGLWKSVDNILGRTPAVRNRIRRWAVEEACLRAEDAVFLSNILHHCGDEQLPTLLSDLQIRGMWAADSDFRKNILPHFSPRQLDSLVMFLVAKRMWQSVGEVLWRKELSPTWKSWAVKEASKKADCKNFECHILQHCRRTDPKSKAGQENTDSHPLADCENELLETVVTNLVDRGMWESVANILEKGVSNSLHRWAISIASKNARAADFEQFILPHCNEQQITSVLANLRKRGLLPGAHKTGTVRCTATLHGCFLQREVNRTHIFYQLAKTSDPFLLALWGQSVMMFAVRNNHIPNKMVVECIKLGFSTYQPMLTTFPYELVYDIVNECNMSRFLYPGLSQPCVTSPFLFTIVSCHFTVAHMLYESGSCSYEELFYLYQSFPNILDPLSEDGQRVQNSVEQRKYRNLVKWVEQFMPCLTKMATTPRSLMSSCRLVISHCLKVHEARHKDVQQLPLSQMLKDYVLFSDITDPDYSPSK